MSIPIDLLGPFLFDVYEVEDEPLGMDLGPDSPHIILGEMVGDLLDLLD